MFGRPNQSKSNSETFDRLLRSTNDYIEENWAEESRRPPTRKVGGRPEGARAGPLSDGDDRYVTQAALLSFFGLNMLMGLARAFALLGAGSRPWARNSSAINDVRTFQIHFETFSDHVT
jgi:hypothetical protein